MSEKDLGPLDWRIAIVDKSGRPTPEFQRRWNLQRGNNAAAGTLSSVGIGSTTLTVTNSPLLSDGVITVDLPTISGVAGTYSFPTLTVDSHGRITVISSTQLPLTLSYIIQSGTTGTNVGPELIAPRAGVFNTCKVVTKVSDATNALTFTIKKNGTTIFGSAPSVAAGTSGGTVSTFTVTTTSVAQNDVFTCDITTGAATWQVTIQLET